MKKSFDSKHRHRQTRDTSYSTSGDDSYNNSIYQIRTNHQKKSIPYQSNSPVDTQPSIIWVNPDNQDQYHKFRIANDKFKVASESGQSCAAYGMRTSGHKVNGQTNPQEVRMVLQARGSPPVELAAKIISKEEAGKSSSIHSGSRRLPRDSSVNSSEPFQSRLKNYSASSRVTDRSSSKDGTSMSQMPDEVYNDTWHPRSQCGGHVCAEDCDPSGGGNYGPGDTQHSSYDSTSTTSLSRRKARRSFHCSSGDQPMLVESCTQRDASESRCDSRPCGGAQPCAARSCEIVRTNKNCNDSKTCDCCMETPKKVSTIYLCEKHPSDSRTYCCREVLDKDLTPTATAPNMVCVSPSKMPRKVKVCECVYPETSAVTPKRRPSCCNSMAPTPKIQSPVSKCNGGECRCMRRTKNQCKSKCTDELSKLFKTYIPGLICGIFKFLFIILVYIFMLWLLRMYTALNHYAHLTLLSANILMLFILLFQPDCLYIYMLGL